MDTTHGSAHEIYPPGTIIGERYEIISHLAQGGMANVYVATQRNMNREVALKVLSSEFSSNQGVVSRFMREAHIVGNLQHPNTVSVYDMGETHDGKLFISMELLKGISLGDKIRNDVIPPDETLPIARQVASSLQDAHGSGIIHRDLKPDNIFLTTLGVAKVLDFGIAKIRDDEDSTEKRLTRAGTAPGTPEYMSPEQARGQDLDARSDLYSLGIVMYEMLCGQPPFDEPTFLATILQHVQSPPPPLPDSIPLALRNYVCNRLLAKDPNCRPDNAEVFIHEIDELSQKLFKVDQADLIENTEALVKAQAEIETLRNQLAQTKQELLRSTDNPIIDPNTAYFSGVEASKPLATQPSRPPAGLPKRRAGQTSSSLNPMVTRQQELGAAIPSDATRSQWVDPSSSASRNPSSVSPRQVNSRAQAPSRSSQNLGPKPQRQADSRPYPQWSDPASSQNLGTLPARAAAPRLEQSQIPNLQSPRSTTATPKSQSSLISDLRTQAKAQQILRGVSPSSRAMHQEGRVPPPSSSRHGRQDSSQAFASPSASSQPAAIRQDRTTRQPHFPDDFAQDFLEDDLIPPPPRRFGPHSSPKPRPGSQSSSLNPQVHRQSEDYPAQPHTRRRLTPVPMGEYSDATTAHYPPNMARDEVGDASDFNRRISEIELENDDKFRDHPTNTLTGKRFKRQKSSSQPVEAIFMMYCQPLIQTLGHENTEEALRLAQGMWNASVLGERAVAELLDIFADNSRLSKITEHMLRRKALHFQEHHWQIDDLQISFDQDKNLSIDFKQSY